MPALAPRKASPSVRVLAFLETVPLLALAAAGPASAQAVREDLYMTNGTVNAVAVAGDTVYVGGSFTAVGAATGAGVPLDEATGLALPGFPKFAGQVHAVVDDGAGGWYVGGAFAGVGGLPRANLARVLADHSVAPWNPGASGSVLALSLVGDTLYVGGTFSILAGQARTNLGAVDAPSGGALSWNPGVDGAVRALAAGNGVVYAAGSFTSAGGQARSRVAAIDRITGLATGWNPGANSTVRAVATGPGSVWIGGDFTVAGAASRARLAELDPETGIATTWNPDANAPVSALLHAPGALIAGGSFTFAGGLPRNRIAALDLASGLATSWDPGANAAVLALAGAAGGIVAGGDFTSIGGAARSRLAMIDAATGLATAWDPTAFGTVAALAVQGGVIWAGGAFNSMGGVARANLAALDLATGTPLAWNPGADQQVLALALGDGVVYAGGSFTLAGGAARNGLAAVDRAMGLATPWDPSASGQVSALAVAGGRVYAGGFFSNLGGAPRANLAALDPATGLALPWNPGTNGPVFALAATPGAVYAGGSFTSAGGAARANLAAFDLAGGAVTDWNPAPNGTVRALAPACDAVYVGGFFNMIGGQARSAVAALDVATGLATSWNPNANGPVFAMVLDRGTAYVGGVLNVIGGAVRNRIAALDPVTGLATPWDPNSDGAVRAIAVGAEDVVAGGSFTAMGAFGAGNLAAMSRDVTIACPVIAIAPAMLPPAVPGTPYSELMTATGGTAPYCWSVVSGTLPPGLTLDYATGALSGTPMTAGTHAFTVAAADARACVGQAAFEMEVECAPIDVVPDVLAAGVVGMPYADTLVAAGATAPLTWEIVFGTLPAGLSLHAGTGAISGTPPAATNSVVEFAVTDVYGCVARAVRVVSVFETPPASVIAAVGGGLCLSTTRTCVSVPFAFTRADSVPVRAVSVTFRIDPAMLGLCTPGNPEASIQLGPWLDAFGNSFQQVTDHGGGTYSVDQVLLGEPCGATGGGVLFTVQLASTGPDGPALVEILDVRTRDCDNLPIGVVAGAPATVHVHNAPMVVLPDTLADAGTGVPYTATFAAGPGLEPFTFAVTGGALPPGLTLAPDGALSGTPLAEGVFAFTVTATDAGGCDGNRAYTLEVTCPPIAALPPTLTHAPLNVPYEASLTASAGTPPFVFAVTSGALPPGLALSAEGLLSGTPTTPGTFPFRVEITDATACEGGTDYTITVTCPVIAVLPAVLPDATVENPYSQTLSASAGAAPFSWAIGAEALPEGLELDPGTGELTGTPLDAGEFWFTATVTDANGCEGSAELTLTVHPPVPVSSVGVNTAGLCLSTANPCVEVPFTYSRTDSVPVRAISVTFQLDPALTVCTPADPQASVVQGAWLDGFASTVQFVTDHGNGSYTVDQAILGLPCGATQGGELFRVRLAAAGPDGVAPVEVVGVLARDCGGAPVGAVPGPAGGLLVDLTAPPPLTDLTGAQVTAGNAPGQTTGILLDWTPPLEGEVDLYRAPVGSDPIYDPAMAPDPALAPGPPWQLVAAAAAPPFVDGDAPRGFWHHVAIVRDTCGNYGEPAGMTAGALSYHLGDVSDGATPGQGDNRVDNLDISLLGSHYGITGATIATHGVAYLDVGPTTDLSTLSRPVPDAAVDFEDLMMFVSNYRTVTAPQLAAESAASGVAGGDDVPYLEVPASVNPGDVIEVPISLRGSGRIQGLSVTLGWDPAIVEPAGHRTGSLITAEGGIVLVPRPGSVDAALLGRRAAGLTGEGEIAVLRFRGIGAGDPGIRIDRVLARDRDNQPVAQPSSTGAEIPAPPAGDELFAPFPNPVRASATLTFALAATGEVELAIYSVDGRRVRGLFSGRLGAGTHTVVWDAADARGTRLPPGIYHARLLAGGRTLVRRLVVLR